MDSIEAGKKLLAIRQQQKQLGDILKEAEEKKLDTNTPVFQKLKAQIEELEQEYQRVDTESLSDRLLTTFLMLGSIFNNDIPQNNK